MTTEVALRPWSAETAASAQSKLEYYLRAESRLSDIPKPEPEENESRGQYAWRVIRHCVKDAINLTLRADMNELTITHGVHHFRKIEHAMTIQHMVYNRSTNEFITTDGHLLRIFHDDGRKKDVIEPEEPFNRLLHAHKIDLYIGWNYKKKNMLLMTNTFEVNSSCNALGPVYNVEYNEHVGEIVTAGVGFVTSWVFRYGGRHLLPRKITQTGFPEDEELTMMVLEQSASRSQRAFLCNGQDTVYAVNLHEGRVISRKKGLHTRDITAILFFNPLKYLVTAAKDGCIKVWDESWHLQLVFVGHCAAVTALAIYPYGPNILSASEDRTIRIWSLETCDEVDIIDTDTVVHSLSTTPSNDTFSSVTARYADIWKVKHVHMLHTRVNHKINLIKVTDHPEYPERGVLLCKDSSVRITSPISGDVITTMIQPCNRGLVDAAYAIADNMLFACFKNGDIVKAYAGTNPCTELEEWKCEDQNKICNYLLVYEYVITSEMNDDAWGGFKRMAATNKGGPKTGVGANRTLLLGGRRDGKICVFNMDSGRVEFEIEGHGSKGVLSMMANSKADQLISAGLDNIIKVWRLYPYAQESLAPLMSFYCAHTPIYMNVLRNKLAVAFQEPKSATYSVVMYNLQGKDREDHGPEDDHSDDIIGLTACGKMRVLASASMDGTIRIWNEANNLIRIIRLNATPTSIAFCSEKGDIFVGVGEHLHKIDYKTYMPREYRLRMVCISLKETEEEKALPYDEELVKKLSKEELRRMKNARSSFKFTHFMDILTESENEEVTREKNLREEMYAKIASREEELIKIRDGELKPEKKRRATKKTRATAFNKYLDMFYKRDKPEMYKEDPYIADKAEEIIKGPKEKPREEWKPEPEPVGFFAKPDEGCAERRDPTLPLPNIRPDALIPNSILYRLLWPQEVKLETESKPYQPPTLNSSQLAQIKSKTPSMTAQTLPKFVVGKLMLSKKFVQKGEDRTLVLDYSDDEKPEEDPEEVYEDTITRPPKAWARMIKDAEATIAKEEEEENEVPEPEEERIPDAPPPEKRRESKLKNIVIPKPKPRSPEELEPAPPSEAPPSASSRRMRPIVRKPSTPEEESPPPRPSTPLPRFIEKYKDEPWFQKYYPNLNEHTLPKPWTVESFVTNLLRILRIGDFDEKNHVLDALKNIHESEGIPNPKEVCQAIYAVLNHHTQPPTCKIPNQREFLTKALEMLAVLSKHDLDFFTELFVQFMEGDKAVRAQVRKVLRELDLRDPHNYLEEELDSWDIWNLEESERSIELRRMARNWLIKWLTSFKMHMEDSIDRLRRGSTIMGKGHADDKGGVDSKKPADSRVTGRIMAVTLENAPDKSTVENATYMDAINYFCDMELEKAAERMRLGGRGSKNTVLVLPKIDNRKGALVRLGETHTSECKPARETSYAVADLRLPAITERGRLPPPGQLYGFPGAINLPMNPVNINPFLSKEEREALQQQPILLMLKTAQKYFVHDRSVVPPDSTVY